MQHKTVWKYRLEERDRQTLVLPRKTEILSVGVQDGRIFVWAKVDPETQVFEPRTFVIVGTGNPVPVDAALFIGTVHLYGGELVLHIFETVNGVPNA